MKKSESLLALLKERGHRCTAVRQALLDLFVEEDKPLSVADLLAVFQARGLLVHKTTLYRELAFLQEQHILEVIRFQERHVRYELADEHTDRHHHHIVCTDCGHVQDVELPEDLARQELYLESVTPFVIQSHALEFFGLCGACLKKTGLTKTAFAREHQRFSRLLSHVHAS